MSGRRLRWVAAEADIDGASRIYEKRGVLSLSKVAPPTLTTGRGIIHLSNPFLDYIGAWTERGGRMLHIEVKSTKEPRLRINGSPGLTDGQMIAFRRWHLSGSACGLVWMANGLPRWVSMAHLFEAHARGDKSIHADDARRITQGVGLLYDFAACLREDYPVE